MSEQIQCDVVAKKLLPVFAERAATHDQQGTFVMENYNDLKRERVFSALIPLDLGGGGTSLRELCGLLKELASVCPSTALALSMHQHLIAALVWKYQKKGQSEALLRRVAKEQLVLVSTGATDWVASNGTMTKVEGGYNLNARKVFSSGCEAADMMITSAQYDCPDQGARVLHFPVSYGADGVTITGDWNTLGMRGTGSHTVILEGVFVPDDSVALNRPRSSWHPAWTVAIASAPPIYMSPYLGIAETAAGIARESAGQRAGQHFAPYLVGEMENYLATAQLAWSAMIENHNDYEFDVSVATASSTLTYKTICTNACIATVEKAMECSGGRGFFRNSQLERFIRDIKAAPYHPLPEKKQHLFTGRLAMGLDPITGH